MILRVAQRDQHLRNVSFLCQLLRPTLEHDIGLTTFFPPDINILPPHRLPNPGPERLRQRFLRREPSPQMARRKFHRLRIRNLTFRENAFQKPFTKALQRMLNPRVLHQIDADAEYAHIAKKKNNQESRNAGKEITM